MKPGDIVLHEGQRRVVVDVAGYIAVLRDPDDLELVNPVTAMTSSLDVVGHLDQLDGWTEDEPGLWRKLDDS